ncbi:MAG: monoheme cytochrome C [Bacteroidota bacterium]
MDEISKKQLSVLTNFIVTIVLLIGVVVIGLLYFMNNPDEWNKPDEVPGQAPTENATEEVPKDTISTFENALYDTYGLIKDVGVTEVAQNCTQCHSAKLVTQNRLSKEGWEATIRWMQETQNLWDLGQNEEVIISYLAKNYGPDQKGRRQNLTKVKWYELQ